MFNDCDTIWCCWMELMRLVGMLAYDLRWPVAIYAAVYAVGAAIFLITLRIQSEDGKLVVRRDSWAYMIAHPMRYGGHRMHRDGPGSICAFYARMLNMLLFVWPFLVVYFLILGTAGNVLLALFLGFVVYPDLREGGFWGVKPLLHFPTAFISIPVLVVLAIAMNAGAVWKWTLIILYILACLLPIIAVLIAIGIIRHKLRDPDSQTASVVHEAFKAKKDRFCKLVEFRGGTARYFTEYKDL